jgi:hypothetical protein
MAMVAALCVTGAVELSAQRAGGGGGARGRGGPPPTPRAAAPIDLTGYWVSVVTEDWRYRMVTPPKGQFLDLPLNAEGRRVGNAWDPAKETAADKCKIYGAASLMRVPGRLHITWADDTTLKIETDAGVQTRVFKFGNLKALPLPPVAERSWQGTSLAQWETTTSPGGRSATHSGNLKVLTRGLKGGYLRTNGVPYSDNTVLTEWYDAITTPDGVKWLVVLTEVNDPMYLTMPFTTTTHFKREPDGAKWDPMPCE